MRILGKKKGEKNNTKVGGGEKGSGGRWIGLIHISHWWRHELLSTASDGG